MHRLRLTAPVAGLLVWTVWQVGTPSSSGANVVRDQSASIATTKTIPMPKGGNSNVELSSVSCVNSEFCIAVGEYRPTDNSTSYQGEQSVILRFDGKNWSTMRPPSGANAVLNGVNCVSTTFCVAVGDSVNTQNLGVPLIDEMYGNVWSIEPSAIPNLYPTNSSGLQAVSCFAIGRCTAVGRDDGVGYPRGVSATTGFIEVETSTGWSLQQLAPLVPTPEPSAGDAIVPATAFDPILLMSVSCTSKLCVSAGEQNSFIEHNQKSWTVLHNSPLIINGVTCAANRPCIGVGSGGSAQVDGTDISTTTSIARLSGTDWTRVSSPNSRSSSNTLTSVACGTAESCVAVGAFVGAPSDQPRSKQQGGTLIEVESNGRWHLLPSIKSPADVDDTLASVSCPSSHLCVAVGQSEVNALRAPSGPIRSLSVMVKR
jgi:hypothetical protein